MADWPTCAWMLKFLEIFHFPAARADGHLPPRAWVVAIAVAVIQASVVAWGLAVLR